MLGSGIESVEPADADERRIPITGLHAAALRAVLTRRTADFRELLGQLESQDDYEGFARLLYAAFIDAVDEHFTRDGETAGDAAVIEFVGELRAENTHIIDDIEPSVAERMVSYALGRASLDGIDSSARMRYAATILAQLAEDDYPGEIAPNRFMARARREAEDW